MDRFDKVIPDGQVISVFVNKNRYVFDIKTRDRLKKVLKSQSKVNVSKNGTAASEN